MVIQSNKTQFFSEESFSLNQLDLKLCKYLDFSNGFFIEAGANDGITQSNTLYFEKNRGWSGILIEPIPQLAEYCKSNRQSCIVESCALVPFDYENTEVEMYYCNLMSLVKGAQKTQAQDLDHLERGRQVQGVETYELTVPARTLTSILDQHAVSKINLLSLDVEGYELDVLKGLDFDRYRPDFMLIEARYREEIDTFLQPWYEPIDQLSHHDVLYKSKRKIQEEQNRILSTPILFLIFKRPDLTAKAFEAIAQVKPKKLLVVADGPRTPQEAELCQQTRAIIDRIDWDCEVLKDFSEHNLGCKQRVSSGIDWAFTHTEEVIIVEDDCVPAPSFFYFCQTLLERYRDDQRIMMIGSTNIKIDDPDSIYSYSFSRYARIWGWATWKRAWQHFDRQMATWPDFKNNQMIRQVIDNPVEQHYWLDLLEKVYDGTIDSWGYIWMYTLWQQGGLGIVPKVNLVSNIGFRADASHTTDSDNPVANLPTVNLWDIHHPPFVIRDRLEDNQFFHYLPIANDALQHDPDHLKAQLQQYCDQLQQCCDQLAQTQQQHQAVSAHLDRALDKLKQVKTRNQQLKTRLIDAENRVTAMESSKFWKLRHQWMKLKSTFGLKID